MRSHLEKRWTVCINVYSQIDFSHLFNCESTALSARLVKALRKTEFLWHSSNTFVTIVRDYAGWSLTGNRNQNGTDGISSGLKSDRGLLRNLSSGRLRESFWCGISLRNKTSISTKWSLMGGGRLREVVAMRELTVVSNSTFLNVKNITRLIGPIRWSV